MSMIQLHSRRLSAGLLTLAVLGLAGCGMAGNSANTASPASLVVSGVHGNVHGGQNPVTGATIQLYAIANTLKGSSTALIASPPTTDINGNFNIAAGQYVCPTVTTTQVYLVATGGSSSGAGGPVNTAIALMAPMGPCSTALANAATTYVQINELTTVAAAYALAPFMSGYKNIGTSATYATGFSNGVANFNNLVNLTNGGPGGATLPVGAVIPTAEINTLGNILAACVNTTSSSSSSCNTLFAATSATDTVGAALAIANNPGSSTTLGLFALSTAAPPFQPVLSGVPNDWTLAIKYTASGTMNAPYGIAIDASGNAWITNASGTAVTELSAGGALVSNYSATGLIGPKGIAIDRSGNVWVANTPMNNVIEFSRAGIAQSAYTAGGLNGPVSIAMDSGGNAWVANLAGNSVTELSPSGTALQTGLTASGAVSIPEGIALDASGNVYVANAGGGNVVKFTHAGAVAAGSPFTDVALQGTSAIALDSGSNVWTPGSTTGAALTGSVSHFSSAGTVDGSSPFSGGGLALPTGAATSGTTAFVTNGVTAGSLSQLVAGQSAPVSPAAGFGSLNTPIGVAVDASGDVWTANSGDNTVSVFVGLTSPAITPLAANVGP